MTRKDTAGAGVGKGVENTSRWPIVFVGVTCGRALPEWGPAFPVDRKEVVGAAVSLAFPPTATGS